MAGQLEEIVAEVREKIEKAEEALGACQEAEMPFLKGIEVLPKEESDEALANCDKTAREAQQLITAAKGIIRTKFGVVRTFKKEDVQQGIDQLNSYKERGDAAELKLQAFRRDTDERKTAASISEVVDAISQAEGKAEELVTASKLLSSDGLEAASVEEINEAISKSEEAAKEALSASTSARTAVNAKQGDRKARAGLEKLQNRLRAVQDKITKHKQKISSGKNLIKLKEAMHKEDEKLTSAEEKVQKADDETSKGAGLTEDLVKQLEELWSDASKILKGVPSILRPFLSSASPTAKAGVQKLLDRATKAQASIDKMKKDTKDDREKVLKEVYSKEAEAKTQKVEEIAEKMNDAELPYLKGIEVMPLQEALDCVTASEAAAKATQEAVSSARNYIASKTSEMKTFKDAKEVLEKFPKLTEQINAVGSKLSSFKKDTEVRKKAAQMQHAGVKVGEVEELLKKVVEAAEPFHKEGAEKLVAEENSDILQKFTEVEKEITGKMNETKTFINECRSAASGAREKLEAVQKLSTRLSDVTAEISKAKKALAAVKSKCDALVNSCYSTAAKALRDEMVKRSISCEDLFSELAQKGTEITDAAFCSKLSSLEGLAIEAVHAKLLSKKVCGDGLTLRRFMKYVKLYLKVTKPVAMTDALDVSTCKTLKKAEQGEILEVLEGPLLDEGSKLERVRARSVMDGTEGWIAIKGNTGSQYMNEVPKPYYSPIKADVSLHADFPSASASLKTLKAHEIIELIEGPKKEEFPDIKRARVKVGKDNAVGWVTLVDRLGTVYAEANGKLLVCSQTIALTDNQDVSTCKIIRKLDVGEFFEASGDVVVDASSGVSRVEGKALKDGKAGWITTKGNAGTKYAEPSTKEYNVKAEVNLEKGMTTAGAESIRKLEVGETFKLLEGPRVEKVPAETRLKVRCMNDKQVGWVSLSKGALKSWTGTYKCKSKANLEDKQAGGEGVTIVKELVPGENLEHIEGPHGDDTTLRLKCKSLKDGSVGWVTLKDAEGKTHFESS